MGYVHVEEKSRQRAASTFWEHTFNIPKHVANRNLLQQHNVARFGRRQVCLDSLLDHPCECAGCDWNIMMNIANDVVSVMVYPRPSAAHEIKLPNGYLMTYKVVVRVLNQRMKGDDFSQSWVEEWDHLEQKLRQRPHPIFNLSSVTSDDSQFVYNDPSLSTLAFQLHVTLSVTFSYDNLIQPRMAGVFGACLHQLEQEVARLELELKKEKGKSSELKVKLRDEASTREEKLIEERDKLIAKNKKIAESNERVLEYVHQLFPKQMQDMNSKLWETTNKCMSTFSDSMHKVQSLVENLKKEKSWQNDSSNFATQQVNTKLGHSEIKTIVEAAINPVLQLLANQNQRASLVPIPVGQQDMQANSYTQQPPPANLPEPSPGNYRTPLQLPSQPDIPKAPMRPAKPVLFDSAHPPERKTNSEQPKVNPFSTNVTSEVNCLEQPLFGTQSSNKQESSTARGIFGIGKPSKETSIFETQTSDTAPIGLFGEKTKPTPKTGLFGPKTDDSEPVSIFGASKSSLSFLSADNGKVQSKTGQETSFLFGKNNINDDGNISKLFSSGGGSGLFSDSTAEPTTTVPQFQFTTLGTGGSKSGSELQLGVGTTDTKTDAGLFGNSYSDGFMSKWNSSDPSSNFNQSLKKTESTLDEPVSITFKPMYTGLQKKEVDTGHKNEKVLFSERCKVYRNLEGTFTERGKGNMEIYKDLNKNTARLVLRQEITLKIRLNQAISTIEGLTQVNDKRVRWVNVDFGNPDYNPEEGKALVFLAGFQSSEITNRFFDLCTSFLVGAGTEASTTELQQKTAASPKPLFGKNTEAEPTSLFGGKSNSLFSGTPIKSFESGISTGPTSFLTGVKDEQSATQPSYEQYEPSNITFKPMYEGLKEKTIDPGHKNETLLFSERSKVFRNLEGNFTERGKGNLEIYQNKNDKSARLLLRQEVTLKIRVHQGLASMQGLTKVTDKRVRWINFDFGNTDNNNSDGDALTFLAGFKTEEVTNRFLDLCNSLSKTSKEEELGQSLELQNQESALGVTNAEQGEDENILGTPPIKSLSPEPLQACTKTLDFKSKPNESAVPVEETRATKFESQWPAQTFNTFEKEQLDGKPEGELSDIKFNGFPAFQGGSAFGSKSTFGSGAGFGGVGNDAMFSSGIFGKKQSPSNFAEVNPLTGKSAAQPGVAVTEEDDDEEDPEKFHMHDQTALFKGQASTGHETETLIQTVGPAKLYRFDKNQWKARGMGKFQFWQTPEGKIRLVMREALTEKLRLNHYVDPQIPLDLKDGAGNVFMWVGDDYCPEDGGMTAPVSQSRSFSAKFKKSDTESIQSFKENYENAQRQNMTCVQTQE